MTSTDTAHAWVDARNGVAGDMLLAALLDAGADLGAVTAAVEAVLPATVRLDVHEVQRAGLRALKVDVTPLVDDHHHRDWTTIRTLLIDADLPQRVRHDALAVFEALARAEARAHGIDIERVHFHEVGAWDSIADVVGVCAAVADLGLTDLRCGVLGVGSGTVRAAHGEIPVPVPAVVQLALGWPVTAGGTGELATPTGVALLTALCTSQPELPDGVLRAVGVGAGSRDDSHRPNVVRVLLGRFETGESAGQGAVELATNVGDLDPRLWPDVLARLLAAGADDAWLAPILMKKGRPAHTLHVLAHGEPVAVLRALIPELVPTLGVREHAVVRTILDRRWEEVSVDGQIVRIKLGLRDSEVLTATPEFVDVAAAAEALGRTQRAVLAAAISAWEHGGS